MNRKNDELQNLRRGMDGRRNDRVKKPEIKKMQKLLSKDKTIAEIAAELKRSERTVSKYLEKSKASGQRNERMFDPLVMEAKKKHIADMAAIGNALLANGLDTVRKHPSARSTAKYEYSTVIGDSLEVISHEQLGDRLRVNLGVKWVHTDDVKTKGFLSHLKFEYPELESKDILTIVTENPYELIEAIRVFIRRGTLKGKCDICQQLG